MMRNLTVGQHDPPLIRIEGLSIFTGGRWKERREGYWNGNYKSGSRVRPNAAILNLRRDWWFQSHNIDLEVAQSISGRLKEHESGAADAAEILPELRVAISGRMSGRLQGGKNLKALRGSSRNMKYVP
jgi:hypothetical protein